MRIYPKSSVNRNVPPGVFLVAETMQCSREMINTYYIDNDGNMLVVCDWVDSKPQPVTLCQLCRLTWDTEQMITRGWQHFQEGG